MGGRRWMTGRTAGRTWLTACVMAVAGMAYAPAPATAARAARVARAEHAPHVPYALEAIAGSRQSPSAQPQPPDRDVSPEDRASTAAFVEAYYAALNASDVDAVIRLWSREMPSRGQMAETLDRMVKTVAPAWTDVQVTAARVEADRARVIIQFRMTYRPSPGSLAGASSPFARRTLFVLAREQEEWRLYEEKTVEQDLAERLLALNDDAAALALAASELAAQGPDGDAGAEIAVIRALVGLGGNAASRQRHDEALRAFGTARQMVERVKTEPGGEYARTLESLRAQTLSHEASVYMYRPRPDAARALTLLEQALSIYEASGDKTGTGEALLGMATAAYTAADYARALTLYERAQAIHTELRDTPSIVRELIGIGNVRYLFAQLDDARRVYREARAEAETLGMTGDATRALQGLGRVSVAMGDYARGRDQYLEALKLIEASGARAEEASALLEIGRVEFLRGDFDAARERYGRALAIEQQLKDAFGEGRAYYALALVDVLQASYDAAIKTYTSSIDAYKKGDSAVGAGEALLGRAATWLEQQNLKPALADFTEGLAIFERMKHVEGMARANLGLAVAQVTGKNAAAALTHADRATQLADRAVMPDIRWQARFEAGRAWLLNGDAEKARAAFEEAVETIESGRLDAATDARTPARRSAPYAALVEWHIAHGDALRALLAADDEKRRVLEDLLQPFRLRLARGLTSERVAEEQRLIGQRVSLLAQIRREVERGAAGEARMAALQQTLRTARDASADWDAAVAREAPRTPFLRGESRLSSLDALTASLTAALPADAALIHFVSSDDHLSVIVATQRIAETSTTTPATTSAETSPVPTPEASAGEAKPELDVRAYTIDISRRALGERVTQFADRITAGPATTAQPGVEADAESLFDLLLGQARAQIDGRAQLVIVPDDALWTLPFEALRPSAERYLIEQAATTYLPSVAAWLANPSAPDANAAESAASAPESAAIEGTTNFRWADAEISDVSPLQSMLTFVDDDSVAIAPHAAAQPEPSDVGAASEGAGEPAGPQPHAASDWLSRSVTGDLAIVWHATRSPARLRLDVGRLGGAALAWALSAAGLPKTLLARRDLDPDARALAACAFADALGRAVPRGDAAPAVRAAMNAVRADAATSDPHDWAVWQLIGPPSPVRAAPAAH